MNSKSIRKFFHPFTKIPGVRLIFGGLYRSLIYKPIRKKEIQKFHNNALVVLQEFDEIFQKLKIPYCLFWGSLIGAVREKGFIKHDIDIDVAMWKDDFSEDLHRALTAAGFRHVRRFLIDDGQNGMEDTYEKSGVPIDIFYFVTDKESGKSFCCTLDYINGEASWEDCFRKYGTTTLYRYEIPLSRNIKYTQFENIKLPIPENFDFILRGVYGENYMIPDPKWKRDEANPFIHKWDNRNIKYQSF